MSAAHLTLCWFAVLVLPTATWAVSPARAPDPVKLCLKFEEGAVELKSESKIAFAEFLRTRSRYVKVVVRYDSTIQDRSGAGKDVELSAVELALKRQRAITGAIERVNGGPAQGLWSAQVSRFGEEETGRECQAYVY